jgi:hypothetical protein
MTTRIFIRSPHLIAGNGLTTLAEVEVASGEETERSDTLEETHMAEKKEGLTEALLGSIAALDDSYQLSLSANWNWRAS